MATGSNVRGSAVKALQKEFKELIETPVEGFKVTLTDESNLFMWDVAIFGPPQTLYEGGYFKARLAFPADYPYSPPTMKFVSKMFHPNVFENGTVCISILHSPGEDLYSNELPSERWNPTQHVRTILLSVISLLNEPNIHSAAHVDASVAYRNWIESNGKDNTYEQRVKQSVEQTKSDAAKDGVSVPTTREEYCAATRLMREHTLKSYEEEEEDFSYGIDTDDEYDQDTTNDEDGVDEDNFQVGVDDDEGVVATTAAQHNAVSGGSKIVTESTTTLASNQNHPTSTTAPLPSSSSRN